MFFNTLRGQLLLASPTLTDPPFADSVILLCHQNEEGSMGLLINHPQSITVGTILKDMKLAPDCECNNVVFEGGPLELFRGFMLHDSTHQYDATTTISEGINLTTSKDALEEIAKGNGPTHYMLLLGYTGWAAGQLETEIQRNDWIVAPATADLVFRAPDEAKWTISAQSMGINKHHLSNEIGHA